MKKKEIPTLSAINFARKMGLSCVSFKFFGNAFNIKMHWYWFDKC